MLLIFVSALLAWLLWAVWATADTDADKDDGPLLGTIRSTVWPTTSSAQRYQ
jgi:hypothetical protein